MINQVKPRVILSPKDVLEVASELFTLPVHDILAKNRLRSIVNIRKAIIYILRQEMGLSLSMTGRYLASRHHTTVLSALYSVNNALKYPKSYTDLYNAVIMMQQYCIVINDKDDIKATEEMLIKKELVNLEIRRDYLIKTLETINQN